ncbi:hypothetical protein T03_11369 [Trichinella britovi]|uniref:Uncharacterized protein n=1 Tax=Trichinella britovi TaxID=45882 RepID=A0A0V1AQC0_TRIBR|nr:hypothetical protein T03_11369 [Trichinella britovi]
MDSTVSFESVPNLPIPQIQQNMVWYQDLPVLGNSPHGMKKKYCAQYDCSETLLLGAKLTVEINTQTVQLFLRRNFSK